MADCKTRSIGVLLVLGVVVGTQASEGYYNVKVTELPRVLQGMIPQTPKGWKRDSQICWKYPHDTGVYWSLENHYSRRLPSRKRGALPPLWRLAAVSALHPNTAEAHEDVVDTFSPLARSVTPPVTRGIPGKEQLPADEVLSTRHGNMYEVYARKGRLTVAVTVEAGSEAFLSDRDVKVANLLAEDLLRRRQE